MKTKKLLAAFLSAAMVTTSASIPVFATDPVKYGTSEPGENNTCKLVMNEGVEGSESTLYYDSILDAINDTQFEGCTGTIYMLKDETITEEGYKGNVNAPYIYKSIKITSIDPDNPCTIHAGKKRSPLLWTANEPHVTLELENIIIDGDSENEITRKQSLITVSADTELNLRTGAVIENSHISSGSTYGAAMMVRGKGTVNMYDGSKITGCTCFSTVGKSVGAFGAIYINGTFTMYGGEISNNSTQLKSTLKNDGGGGAVFITNKGSFIMEGGKITGNSVENGKGGAIYMYENSTFKMDGGEITGNMSDTCAGGIFVEAHSGSNVYLSGDCVITDNTSEAADGIDGNLYIDGTEAGVFANLYAGNFEDNAYVDLYVNNWEKAKEDGSDVVKHLTDGANLTETDLAHFNSEGPDFKLSLDGEGNFEVTNREPEAKGVAVYFKATNQKNKYDIILKGSDEDIIHKLNTADLTFKNAGQTKYAIREADGGKIDIINAGDDRYEFHFNTKDDDVIGESDIGTEIVIGTVEFLGYGSIDFSVDDTARDTNAVHATTLKDSIVTDFIPDGSTKTGTGKLTYNENMRDYLGTITGVTLEPTTVPVTVNVMFPNKLADEPVNMEDMTVTVKGGNELDEDGNIKPFETTIPLSDNPIQLNYNNPDDETAEANANGYKLTVYVPVPDGVGNRFTFTFSGLGYRTYSVDAVIESDDTDPSVTVWNNVMDEGQHVVVINGDKKGEATVKTFLAGDIVEDNTINLYDLSAVAAYFGKDDDDMSGYVQYDLNRDGQIDSKDIAMVLVSWGY